MSRICASAFATACALTGKMLQIASPRSNRTVPGRVIRQFIVNV